MRLLAEVWAVLTPLQRVRVLWAQVLSLIMAFATVLGIASVAPYFAVLGDPHLLEHAGWTRRLYEHLGFGNRGNFEVFLGVGFVALVLAANAINVAGIFVLIRLAAAIGADLQSELLRETLARPLEFHLRTHSAALLNEVMQETMRATNDVLQNLLVLVTHAMTCMFIVACITWLKPGVALGLTMALIGGYAGIYLLARKPLLRSGTTQTRLYTEQTRLVNESLMLIREILMMRLGGYFNARFERASRAYACSVANTQLINLSPKYVMESVAVMGLAATTWLMARDGNGLAAHLGELTFLGFAAYRLLPNLQQAYGALVKIRAGTAGFEVIAPQLRAARARSPTPPPAPWRHAPCRDIVLEDVVFTYGSEPTAALDSVTLRLAAHSITAIAGGNGAGKTTLINILAGVFEPQRGRVLIDGVTLDDDNRASWQSCIAYVPQDIPLLDASIQQNIALGCEECDLDVARLEAAVRGAQLCEFLALLPGGAGHRVGERGVALSGGQRQKIGIARALYGNASVLILDEATHALDAAAEVAFMQLLAGLRARYTVIVIAHGANLLNACDRVVELGGGRITADSEQPAVQGAAGYPAARAQSLAHALS